MYKNLPFLELIAVDLYYNTEGRGMGVESLGESLAILN